jgi:hypothetical protein
MRDSSLDVQKIGAYFLDWSFRQWGEMCKSIYAGIGPMDGSRDDRARA